MGERITQYCAKNTTFGNKDSYTKKVRIGDTKEDVNIEQRKYKKKYFGFYQSHTQSKGAVVEAAAVDIKTVETLGVLDAGTDVAHIA